MVVLVVVEVRNGQDLVVVEIPPGSGPPQGWWWWSSPGPGGPASIWSGGGGGGGSGGCGGGAGDAELTQVMLEMVVATRTPTFGNLHLLHAVHPDLRNPDASYGDPGTGPGGGTASLVVVWWWRCWTSSSWKQRIWWNWW